MPSQFSEVQAQLLGDRLLWFYLVWGDVFFWGDAFWDAFRGTSFHVFFVLCFVVSFCFAYQLLFLILSWFLFLFIGLPAMVPCWSSRVFDVFLPWYLLRRT